MAASVAGTSERHAALPMLQARAGAGEGGKDDADKQCDTGDIS
jgi:hypothetical protein